MRKTLQPNRPGCPEVSTQAHSSFELMARKILETGGITLHLASGCQPNSGYAVAPSKRTELKIPARDFCANDLIHYARRHEKLLGLPGMYLGARVKEGVVYLDVSMVTSDIVTATVLALDSNQFAIRCLHNSRSLDPNEAATPNEIALKQQSKEFQDLKHSIKAAIECSMQNLPTD